MGEPLRKAFSTSGHVAEAGHVTFGLVSILFLCSILSINALKLFHHPLYSFVPFGGCFRLFQIGYVNHVTSAGYLKNRFMCNCQSIYHIYVATV